VKKYALASEAGIEEVQEIIEVSLGRKHADLVISNGTVLNVYTGEYMDNCSVAIKGKWIAYVGDSPDGNIGSETDVIDAKGKFVLPGFIDAHGHLADSLYNPYEFLRHAMVHGITTIVTETIEAYPGGGDQGIIDFLQALEEQPIKIFATVPPMVSTSRSAHGIPLNSLKKLLERNDVLGLGESYWQGVLQDPETFLPLFREALSRGGYLEGHSAGARGRSLMAYLELGISSCHEPITADEALERLRFGVHVMAREGSIRRELADISRIKDRDVDLRRLMLVTDGVSAVDLMEKGYMKDVVQKAIDLGFDPVKAIQMVTINPADYFRLDGIIGGIAPGKHADLLILSDPRKIEPEYVISMGRILAREGSLLLQPRKHAFSGPSLNSVRLPRELTPSDFVIPASRNTSPVKARIIELITGLVTRELFLEMPVKDGELRTDRERDILKVSAIDRRFDPGKSYTGLVRGFGLKEGAFASSSAWDTANIIVVGENDEDMARAVNRVHSLRGGIVFCSGGKILVEIPLPIFGLMSEMELPELYKKILELRRVLKEFGCPLEDPYRTLTTLTGAAIPFLRICEDGLVDIKEGKIVDLIVH